MNASRSQRRGHAARSRHACRVRDRDADGSPSYWLGAPPAPPAGGVVDSLPAAGVVLDVPEAAGSLEGAGVVLVVLSLPEVLAVGLVADESCDEPPHAARPNAPRTTAARNRLLRMFSYLPSNTTLSGRCPATSGTDTHPRSR